MLQTSLNLIIGYLSGNACSGLHVPVVSRKQSFLKSNITNPLLSKLVQSRWLDFGLVLFFFLRVFRPRSINTQKCRTILTSHFVNNPHLLYAQLCEQAR